MTENALYARQTIWGLSIPSPKVCIDWRGFLSGLRTSCRKLLPPQCGNFGHPASPGTPGVRETARNRVSPLGARASVLPIDSPGWRPWAFVAERELDGTITIARRALGRPN